jgi:hypothetical protein
MRESLKYPVGMQSFPNIRQDGYLYVDKTEYIIKLQSLGKYFFLGRPRRFGKSLFLSTLEAYYQGRKDLFKGLAIYDYEKTWTAYEVLHLDFTGKNYSDADSLDNELDYIFTEWEEKYAIQRKYNDPELRFRQIIKAAHIKSGREVVLLIDEYDKPLLDTVNNPERQDKFRNILRGIYGNLKKMDSFIKFAMLTGVSRFGKLNIFSDINNLNDISMSKEFGGVCGITPQELHHYFEQGVEDFAEGRKITTSQAYNELKANYDGYHFTEECTPDVYNPYSLLSALQNGKINDYWFETGTPKHLIDIIKKRKIKLENLEDVEDAVSNIRNVSFDLDSTLVPLLYQSGYLTIKGYEEETDMLQLGYPNNEVKKGFLLYLMATYTEVTEQKSWTDIISFYRDIKDGRADAFMQRLQSMYADFNRDGFKFITLEQHYQDVAYLVFRLLGCLAKVEYKTATGRIDIVVEMPDCIYLFEFKRNSSPEVTLAQIEALNYSLAFKADNREIIKIGANFCDKIRGLESWKIVKMGI